jgi:hypothetical protein
MLELVLVAALRTPQEPTPAEDLVSLRAAWLGAADDALLARATDIAAAFDFAWDHGFNAVFPVAWRPNGPLWPSLVTKGAGGPELDPKWVDPRFASRNVLTEIVIEGHRAGLEVVPVLDLVMQARRDPKTPLNPLDPALQAFTKELVDELVGQQEVDALAFDAHGLAEWKPLDAKGLAALGDFVAELRAVVDKRDPNVKFVLVDGGAGQAPWMERGLFDCAVPRLRARDADAWSKSAAALAAEPWRTKARARVAPLLDLADGAWKASTEFVLAAVAKDRELGIMSEVVGSLTELKRDDGALAFELAREPYYGLALVPWRDGVAWRAKSDAVQPRAGEGQWEWFEDASGVRLLGIANEAAADASWTLTVIEKGKYDLYTWIPPLEDACSRFSYSVAKTDGVRGTTIDPRRANYQGWVYLGTVPMGRRETREVAKLSVDGKEPGKRAFAGPVVAIQSRRPR